MDSLAFNDAVNQLEASYGVQIPASTRSVVHKFFRVYGEYLSESEGALGLLRNASLELVENLDSDIEEIMLDEDEFYLDRAFVELKELERDLNSQHSFYLPHVRKEYNGLEAKWKEFAHKWSSMKWFPEIENRVVLLIQLDTMVAALSSQEHERVDEMDHSSLEIRAIHSILDQLGRTFHDDFRQNLVVSPSMIIKLASSSVRIPPSHLSRQLNLPPEGAGTPFLGSLIGLDHIFSFIVEAVSKKKPFECPLGSFLLLGRSGRGRTELARALAKQLFDNEDRLALCDMSGYQDADSGQRLRDDLCGDTLLGKLVDISKRKAYGVLMFANIEKASPCVLEMIVSIVHEGILKNREGMLVDLTAVLVLTKSNAGNDEFLKPCCCLDDSWKVKQILSGHQQLQIEHKNQCYYRLFLEKTSMHFSPEFIGHLDEVLVLPHPIPVQCSEITRIQLRKLIPEIFSPMPKKVLVYLSQAALMRMKILLLLHNGGHATKDWLEKEIVPELQKFRGHEIEDWSIVYVDLLVGTHQFSCRVESVEYLLNDSVYGKFKRTLRNLRMIYFRNKRHFSMIHKLRMYTYSIPYNAGVMHRTVWELLNETFDFKRIQASIV